MYLLQAGIHFIYLFFLKKGLYRLKTANKLKWTSGQ